MYLPTPTVTTAEFKAMLLVNPVYSPRMLKKEKLKVICYIFPYFLSNPATSAQCFIMHPVFMVCSPVAAWALLANNRQQNWCVSGGSSWSWLCRDRAVTQAWQTHWHRDPNLSLLNHLQCNQVLGITYFRQTVATLEQRMCVFLKYPLKLKAIVETPGKRADWSLWDVS